MNERIWELELQSYVTLTKAGLDGRNEKTTTIFDREKFAELIVFECTKAVMDGTKEGDHYAQRIEQHFGNGTGGILHFGVEE